MVLDLISHEVVNRFNRLWVAGRDSNSRALLDALERVGDVSFQSRHSGYTGRRFSVSKHGHAEIAALKSVEQVPGSSTFFWILTLTL